MSIYFNNQSTVVTNTQIQVAIIAWNKQLDGEFAYAWGKPHFMAMLTILDEPGPGDQPNALGYHDRDANNQPYARIFAKLAIDNGYPWTGVASHELLEMTANPYLDRFAVIDTSGGAFTSGYIMPNEVCDATESQFYTITLATGEAVQVSNFVLPAWYIRGAPEPYDHLHKLTAPLQIARGGYAQAEEFTGSGLQSFSNYRKVHTL